MRRIAQIVVACVLLAILPAARPAKEAGQLPSAEQVIRWIKAYRMKPEPDGFARVVKGLKILTSWPFAANVCEKSPCLCRSVGTVRVDVNGLFACVCSYSAKKKVLFLISGPPSTPPPSSRRRCDGCGGAERGRRTVRRWWRGRPREWSPR